MREAEDGTDGQRRRRSEDVGVGGADRRLEPRVGGERRDAALQVVEREICGQDHLEDHRVDGVVGLADRRASPDR